MHSLLSAFRFRVQFLAGCIAMLACATSPPSGGGPTDTASDERAIRAIIENQTRSWTAGDAVTYSRAIAEDGIFTNILGQAYAGREAFIRQHEVIFQGLFRNTTAHQDITVLRFPARDVAVVETLTAITGLAQMPPGAAPDREGRLRTRLLQVLIRRGAEWQVVAYHNVDVKPVVPLPEPGAR